ncbi:MAG: adenosine kinase [Paracoccaceae bacterium]
MSEHDRIEVVAIGNAIVDVIAEVDDGFLSREGIEKGVMQLIDTERARTLYAAMPPAREISGGSAANTIAGLAALGHRTAFVGKTRTDQLGRIFAHDIRALGTLYDGPFIDGEAGAAETARCLVLVTPDGERSMNTYLGVSGALVAGEIDEALMARADWLYLEGYLFDSPEAKAAYERAIRAVRAAGGRVAFSVSDPFCVHRHRADMTRLIAEGVDLLFANRAEALALYETDDLETALDRVAEAAPLAAVTLSEEGAIVVTERGRFPVPAVPTRVADTTGAGDLFAAGFLAGVLRGREPMDCARMGAVAAAEIVSHLGARPEADLGRLMAEAGL